MNVDGVSRDRSATEERILAAVGDVLMRDGFGGIGVNAIARSAGIDKVLIYRYFGGLPELLQAWGASGRFWPDIDELLGDDPQALLAQPEAERWVLFFEHFIDGLRARPMTLEILAAEIAERNELTAILETEREQWGEQVAHVLAGPASSTQPYLADVARLLIAGVQYLLVRSRKMRVFGGVDIRSDAGWAQLKASIGRLARTLLGAATPLRSARPAPRRTAQRRR